MESERYTPKEVRDEIKNAPLRTESLTEILAKVDEHINGKEGDGIFLFPDNQHPQKDNEREQGKYATNVVYDGLMDTLSGIVELSANRAQSDVVVYGERKRYETVARALEPLMGVWSSLATEAVPLTVDTSVEDHYRKRGDQVYTYKTGGCSVGERPYDNITVFIRPMTYSYTDERTGESVRKPARLNLKTYPSDAAQAGSSMRIDLDNNQYYKNEIIYDINVGTDEQRLIEGIDLNESKGKEASHYIRNEQGHHFSSNIKEEDLGVPFSEVMETFVDKMEANRARFTSPEA